MNAKRIFEVFLAFVWMVAVTAGYTYFYRNTELPCDGSAENILDCQLFHRFYAGLGAFSVGIVGLLILLTRSIVRPMCIGAVALGVFYSAYLINYLAVGDLRAYPYRFFITSFYVWACLVLILQCALHLFSRNMYWIVKLSFAASAIAAVIFIVEGRGSGEHIFHLLGFVSKEFSIGAILAGLLPQVMVLLLAVSLIGFALRYTFYWVTKTSFAELKSQIMLHVVALSCALLPLVSLPPGMVLNREDVHEAQAFIDTLAEKVETYQKAQGVFPRLLEESGILLNSDPRPRLIKLFEFLAQNTKGGFYFSRPEKYCFLMMDPGINFGYFSRTSESGWQFYPFDGRSLEVIFLEVCGEPKPAEQRVIDSMDITKEQKEKLEKMVIEEFPLGE